MAQNAFIRSLRFPKSTLPRHQQSACLLGLSHELLKTYGESVPRETHLYVCGPQGPCELRQFMDLGETVDLLVTGPHADQLCKELPAVLQRIVPEITFDEDGFCQDPEWLPDSRVSHPSPRLAA